MVKGWQEVRLGDVAEIISGSTPKTNILKYWENGTITWITPNDLNKLTNKYIKTSERKITIDGLKSCSTTLIKDNALIMSSRAPIGYLAISKNFCTNQGCKSFIFNKKYSTEYFYYGISFIVNKFKQIGEGTTFSEISKSQLENFSMFIPTSKTEQEKIAKILTSIDDMIEVTTQIVAKQKRIKIGLMQDLLTYGIDERGNIRSGWKKIKVGDILNINTGDMNAEDSVIGGIYPFFTRSIKTQKINHYAYDTEALFIAGEGNFDIKYYKGKFNIHQRTYMLTAVEKEKVDLKFLQNAIQPKVNKLVAESVGSTVQSLRKPIIQNIEIIIPTSTTEQKKIASILSKQDEVIENEEAKLKKLKRLKKALMQDLLTAKVRVRV